MSDTTAVDDDLRDVFRSLYQDDDEIWEYSDDEADKTPSTGLPGGAIHTTELDSVDKSIDAGLYPAEKYTKKRFITALDSLFDRSEKRQRVYQTPPTNSLMTTTPSTSALPPISPVQISSSSATFDLSSFNPFSPLPLLSRLRTFQPATYPQLQSPLHPGDLALGGWANVARNQVQCVTCGQSWTVNGIQEIVDSKVRTEVIKRMGLATPSRHRAGCPWKSTRSPETLLATLRTSLHPMLSSSLVPLATKIEQECTQGGEIAWSSPLEPAQIDTLRGQLFTASSSKSAHEGSDSLVGDAPESSIGAFTTAAAVFGWYPYQPNQVSKEQDSSYSPYVDPASPPHRTEIVSCRLCQRRVGLWTFREGKERVFDMLKEHLDWCPIRSTPQDEWWRRIGRPKEHSSTAKEGLLGWVKLSDKMEKKPWRRYTTR